MKKHTLAIKKRDLVGRKVKQLRKTGFLPATVYGKNVKSVSVSVSKDQFLPVFGEVGETGLVELSVEGDTEASRLPAGRQVLIHSVQRDPVTSDLLHVEFHQVDLKEKVHANVPIEFIGTSAAVTDKIGVLLTVLDEVEVEALPANLPDKITVDVASLSDIGQEIKVGNLSVLAGVTLLTDAGLTVVTVGALVSHEALEQAQEEAAAKAAAAPAEVAEGQAAVHQEAKAQEKPDTSKEKPSSPAGGPPEEKKE